MIRTLLIGAAIPERLPSPHQLNANFGRDQIALLSLYIEDNAFKKRLTLEHSPREKKSKLFITAVLNR